MTEFDHNQQGDFSMKTNLVYPGLDLNPRWQAGSMG